MNLLSTNPDQKELVLNDRSLIPNMVHESIRVANPVTYMRRTTKEDTQIGEQKIGPNEKISLWYGAANRDPEIFKNPINMTLEEKMQKNTYLLVTEDILFRKHTANMQLEVVYEKIFERFPDMMQDGDIIYTPNNFVNAIQELPVSFLQKINSCIQKAFSYVLSLISFQYYLAFFP